MRRMMSIFLALTVICICLPALSEEAPLPEETVLPAALRYASSVEEVEAFLLYPPEEGLGDVQPGYIRYISQHRANDPVFRAEYWMGGPEESDLNLNRSISIYSIPYAFHAGNMCTRAVYSMALSYLGIDMTPGAMSAAVGRRDLDPPYAEISDLVGVELVQPNAYVFNTQMENYLTDPTYSPVYLYLTKPDGQEHTLLVVAALPEQSQFLVLDPSSLWLHREPYRVHMIALNKLRTEIVHATFREEFAGSTVLQTYQWRLIGQEEQEAP